jgi:hypothetical protein
MRGLERVKHGKAATADNSSLNDISQQHREHLFSCRKIGYQVYPEASFIVEILDAVRHRMHGLPSDRAGDTSASKQSESCGRVIRMM